MVDDLDSAVDDDLGRIYAALPPLGSPEYVALLRNGTRGDLPPEVLARCYVELRNAKQDEAADATLRRLVADDDRHGYLAPLMHAARRRVRHARRDIEVDDLFAIALRHIYERLGRGETKIATTSWRTFCYYCAGDAAREVYGRKGQRAETGRVPFDAEPETEDWASSPLVAALRPPGAEEGDEIAEVEAFLHETIVTLTDPVEFAVARNLIDPEPARTTGTRGAKPPLVDQLGVDRFVIMRARKKVEAKIKAAVLEHFGADWVQRLFRWNETP